MKQKYYFLPAQCISHTCWEATETAEMFILDFCLADKSSTAKEMNVGDKAENTLKQA